MNGSSSSQTPRPQSGLLPSAKTVPLDNRGAEVARAIDNRGAGAALAIDNRGAGAALAIGGRTGPHPLLSPPAPSQSSAPSAVALPPPQADQLLAATLGLAKDLSLDLTEECVGARFLQTLRDLLPGRALCLRVVEGAGLELTSLFFVEFGGPVRGGALHGSAESSGLLSLVNKEATAGPALQVDTLRGPLLIKRAALRHTGLPADIATSARVLLMDRHVPLFCGTTQGFSVPLVASGELCGLLNCEYPPLSEGRDGRDPKRDEAAVIPLCNQVSVALRNLRLLHRARSLQRQVLQAERLATVGQLAAGVVHELNNPLSSIAIYGDALEKRLRGAGSGFAADAEQAHRICEGAERIQRLTRDLMNYGRTSGEVEAVELGPLVRQALGFCDPLLRQAGVAVRYTCEEGLPVVSAVRTQLQQVVVNLVTNACHAMQALPQKKHAPYRAHEGRPGGDGPRPPGALGDVLLDEGVIRVELRPARLGRHPAVQLSVVDSGVGIAAKHRERVFEPFFSTKTEGQGTGLGLPMVKNIVDAHGGQVSFESELGVGTVFRVLLPAAAGFVVGPGYEATRLASRIANPLVAGRLAIATLPRGLVPADPEPGERGDDGDLHERVLVANDESTLSARRRRKK